ncbi:MAG: hypothetical protein GF331_03965 [Chitinivibrionales bacterium]|nr:hypothetical protein [Chitinivibrionales bacterium]
MANVPKPTCMAQALGTAAFLLLSLLAPCSADDGPCGSPRPIPSDTRDIPMPKPRERHHIALNIVETSNAYLLRPFDIARQIRRLNDSLPRAMNAGPFGEVPNSSWYTNRNVEQRMTLGDIARGPNTTNGPDTSGHLRIIRAKDMGLSPGFTIRDSRGHVYIIKFDPKSFAELSSGAEVISTKILYAAGYWVPENYITVFDTAKLLVDSGVEFIDRRGFERPMQQDDLSKLFREVTVLTGGKVRALASRYIEGEPLGSWLFRGTRRDDPNDFIPHEHRREIRGLRVIGAWINHFDAKPENNYDSYVTVDGKSFVRHYLLDFGSTLGASTSGPMYQTYGHENAFDVPIVLLRIITLGLYNPPYMRWDTLPSPAVGTWESRTFSPGEFRFGVPNLAFDNLTDDDGYWAAKVVMSFTDAQIDSIVATAQYANPADAAYVARILKERRDKIGRHYYDRVNPLEGFSLRDMGDGTLEVCFRDMAVEAGFYGPAATRYTYEATVPCGCGSEQQLDEGIAETSCVPLTMPPEEQSGTRCIEVTIQTLRRGREPSKELRAYIRQSAGRAPVLVRIQR